MSARMVILLVALIRLGYDFVTMRLADAQRRRPLPREVSDVYDAARYQKYLDYVADNRKVCWLCQGIHLVITVGLLFSPLFRVIEHAVGGNPYLVFLATLLLVSLAEDVVDIPESYYRTFTIEEKYGLNKQTRRDFAKDTALGIAQGLVTVGGLGLLLAFIGEHLGAWTGGFSVSFGRALLLGLAIAAAIFVFALLASLLSIWVLKRQYTFTPMEPGPLREKIERLQEGSKKKVKQIYIYDESKKTTTKNAFLLKLLWHREFGIADNFITENAEEELLAVLSHEIGHLKHKKNLLNYLHYACLAVLFFALVGLLVHPDLILRMNAWIRTSFGLAVNNYYLWFLVVTSLLTPLTKAISVAGNYRSRQEEYEADREAVANGYGEALIATFKKLSSDELINVNPHPAIEFLEYDHPGMYQRIKAIREAEGKTDR